MHNIPTDWHREFFGGLWLSVQEQSFSDEEQIEIIESACEILQLPDGARLLDVPCGDGRTALEFAAQGFDVTGIELHPDLLERARTRAAERKLDLKLLQQDMWELDAGSDFDAAVCMWTSLGYGTREQDQEFFRSIAGSLKKDGLFLFETHVYETLLVDFEDRLWRWAGDVLVTQERAFDLSEGRLYTDWTFTREKEQERKQSAMQLYTSREVDRMVEDAGMQTVASWGGWDLSAFELGAPILVQLVRKI